jgi:hypothetical protein
MKERPLMSAESLYWLDKETAPDGYHRPHKVHGGWRVWGATCDKHASPSVQPGNAPRNNTVQVYQSRDFLWQVKERRKAA